MEKLSLLFAHEAAINRMEIIEETGHLITQSTDG